MEAEVELAQAKLAEIKAKAKGYAADARIKYARQVDEVEENIERMRAKLQKLGEANDDAREHLKGEIEGAWGYAEGRPAGYQHQAQAMNRFSLG